MAEIKLPQADPRWGQESRDSKAEAILATLQLHCERDLTRGVWLDIGCGSGGVAATLAAHVQRVVGVDPEAWERWPRFCELRPNLGFHAASYRDLERLLGPEAVDVVVCNQVYEHVDDPVAMLAAIHRVMKPGAICYFAGPNFWWPIEPHLHWPFAHWLPRKWIMFVIEKMGMTWAAKWDARPWPWQRLRTTFKAQGFQCRSAIYERVCAQSNVSHGIAFAILRRMPRRLFQILSPIAPGFIFVLNKNIE